MIDQRYLVFVEVRQRQHNRFGSAAESVSQHKQNKLRKTAEHYLLHKPLAKNQWARFDVVAITGTIPNAQIEWIKNAF